MPLRSVSSKTALMGAAPCEALPGGAAMSKCGLDVAAMHEARKALLSMTSIVSAMLSEKDVELTDEKR